MSKHSTKGFTFAELLAVITVIGILSAIAIPSWLGFLQRQRVRVSVDRVHQSFKRAKSEARLKKTAFQVTLRNDGENLAIAHHDADTLPSSLPASAWKSLETGVVIDFERNEHRRIPTTAVFINPDTNRASRRPTGYVAVKFDWKGTPCAGIDCGPSRHALGRVTLTDKHGNLGCVKVMTLLGATQVGKQHDEPRNGFLCY